MTNKEPKALADVIGEPATLEMMAEECGELSHACLKLARYLRGENPTPGHSYPDLTTSLEEEMADVYICLRELRKITNLIDNERVSNVIDYKRKRMYERVGVKADSFIF